VYEADDLTYDYIDAYRLVEVFLGQDLSYSRVRDLSIQGLMIIVLGVADAPNRMLPKLLCQLVTLRNMDGRPTWIYSPMSVGSKMRGIYGNELVDLMGSFPVMDEKGRGGSSIQDALTT